MTRVDILYLDDTLLFVNKSAGLPVLPDGWETASVFLVQLLKREYGPIWLVHRLDKVTSGVMVFARTAEAHRALSIQFEQHRTDKIYHAIANGNPDWTERSARLALRGNVGHKHRTVVDVREGKYSRTDFRVLERFQAQVLLEARPQTGRTHQVRVHAAALHCPLLGDTLYGAPPTEMIARPALHALSLSITHPRSLEQLTCTAPYPEDFSAGLRALARKPR
ncbi:MAG TPA: RluA family pseudouridine synthase [Anaerolineales bacterium]